MPEIRTEIGGLERCLQLGLGEVFDIEEACGKTGIGVIYYRLAKHAYFANDVVQVLRCGLQAGGMARGEAEALIRDQISAGRLLDLHELAVECLIGLMSGISQEESDKAPKGEAENRPLDRGAIMASFIKLGVTPEQVRAMSYADFVEMMRGFGASEDKAPSKAEYEAMVERYTERHGPLGGAIWTDGDDT